MKKTIFSIIFIVEILAGQSWAIDMSNYFPLDSGNSWTYLENGNQYIIDTVLDGTYPLNGSATKIISSSEDNSKNYFSNDSYGIRQHKMVLSDYLNGQYTTITAVLNPPFVHAYPTANIGDKVNTSGTVSFTISGLGTYLLNYHGNSAILGYETVTVPYGTFDTLKISDDLTISGYIEGEWFSSVSSGYSWFAEYIGEVKYYYVDEETTDTGVLVDTNVTLPPDTDGDGIYDKSDSCPNDANNDADSDGICGDVDNCPNNANTDQTDSNSNGIGDACEVTMVPMLILLLLN